FVDQPESKVYFTDRSSILYQLDQDFNLRDHTQLNSPPSHIFKDKDSSLVVSLMGIMDPNDQSRGSIVRIDQNLGSATSIIDSLQRPVHISSADFNNDGKEDWVVCSFGNWTGQLAVFENGPNNYVKHLISSLPGARKSIVRD